MKPPFWSPTECRRKVWKSGVVQSNTYSLSKAHFLLLYLAKSVDANTPPHFGSEWLKYVFLIWFLAGFCFLTQLCPCTPSSAHFMGLKYKICHTVASVSLTSRFHEFFGMIFDGILLLPLHPQFRWPCAGC